MITPKFFITRDPGDPCDITAVSAAVVKMEDVSQYINNVIAGGYSMTEMVLDVLVKGSSKNNKITINTGIDKIIADSTAEITSGEIPIVAVGPIAYGKDKLFYSLLHTSFVSIRDKVMLHTKLYTRRYFFTTKGEVILHTFIPGIKLWPELSGPANLFGWGPKADRLGLYMELFQDISWLDQNMISEISEADLIQVMPCSNTYLIIAEYYASKKKQRSRKLFTPIGTLDSSIYAEWPSATCSIRDFFVKVLGKNWNVVLRSKKNREVFGKRITELNWEDEEFLNMLSAVAFGRQ